MYEKHKVSKLHELRLQYLADDENKIMCAECNIKIDIYQYETHLNRIKHLEKSISNITKIKCGECGKMYREQNFESHLNSLAHNNKLKLKK